MKNSPLMAATTVCFALGLLQCKQREPKPLEINTFSMYLNGQEWKPWQEDNDPCKVNFGVQYNELGTVPATPLFTFNAFRDSTGRTGAYSKNLFRMRLVNGTRPGTYPLTGSYAVNFEAFALFQIRPRRDDSERSRYVNDPRRTPFVIELEKVYYRTPYTSIPSIKGTFSGVLYNEDNPADSLVVTKGKFDVPWVADRPCG